MIEVNYMYRRKGESEWRKATAEFDDCRKAVRFIFKMKRAGAFMLGFSCLDPEDMEYMLSCGC